MDTPRPLTENDISKLCFDAALKVHRTLGPGLLESAYEHCLVHELRKLGLHVLQQHPLPLIYEEVHLETGYRVDILVNNKFIVEVKSVDAFNDVHMAQILTYLKLSNCKLGFLINFNVVLLKEGVKRVISGSL
ncbi:GxxExxY protein [soil metagenome]